MSKLREILDLFENDSGISYTDEQVVTAEIIWNRLSQETRDFLGARSPQELENICIGEVRTDANGTDLWEWGGSWMPLPLEVHQFLNTIFEGI